MTANEQRGSAAQTERETRVRDKLRRELGPQVCTALEDESVLDVMVNPDGSLWIDRAGRGMERAGTMPAHQTEAAISTAAALRNAVADRRNPLLLCELPDGSRFTGKLPPLVQAPSFTIRRHAVKALSLADYVADAIMSERQAAILRQAIVRRENVLIVGGTGSGKTTLVNAVIAELAELCPEHRLIIIEDTRELRIRSPNYVSYRATPDMPMASCVAAALRDRPDRIIVGEARGGEALEIMKAWNTGHPGGFATIHANDAAAGLIRLCQLCAEAAIAPQHEVIAEAVNLVAFIVRTEEGRRVQEIRRVHGWDGRMFLTSNAEEEEIA
jgi:type IV secretion system protein TrbB